MRWNEMKYLHVAIGVGWSQDVGATEAIDMGAWSPAAPPGTTETPPWNIICLKTEPFSAVALSNSEMETLSLQWVVPKRPLLSPHNSADTLRTV